MEKIKGCIKTFAAYAVVLTMLLSLMTFTNDIYGSDHAARMVAIKTFNGEYLCAEDGGGSVLTANRDKIGEWETFQLIDLGKEYIALRGYNGEYVSVSGGGKNVDVDSDEIKQWNIFQLIKLGNNKVALKTHNKKYLCAEDGGGGKVVADRKKIENWETFELIEMNDDQIDFDEPVHSDKCNLTAVSNDRSISFTWTKPSGIKNIIGYNLYRGTASGRQSSTPITDFPIEETSYTDKNVEGGITYYYVLKVVYRDKTIGTASNEVKVSLKSRLSLNAKTAEDGIKLYWTKPSSTKDIIGYNLYRGTASGRQSSTPITDFPIEGTSYTDKNVEDNDTYYYILKAVYEDETLGTVSNEVSIKSDFNDKTIVLEVGSRYMLVNGRREEIDPGKGTTMAMKNGRVFLPIKAVIESLGGEVKWDSANKKVSIYLNDDKIYLWIGDKTAKVNGTNKVNDVAPYASESGRTMLPLRFIIENLGCEAEWDGTTEEVTIELN